MNVKKKTYDITALGEALVDFTEAGKSSAGMRLFEQNPGGAPANLLSAAARLGANTAFIGKVGQDMHGNFLRTTLHDIGVDTRGLIQTNDVFTTMAFVTLDAGEREFSFARKPGADACLTKEELGFDVLDNTAVLHVGSLSLTDEPARSATYAAVQRAKESGALISYDPNYRAGLWNSRADAIVRMQEILPLVDVMKLSDEETELLSGYSDVEKAAGELSKRGVRLIVVTCGKSGAFVHWKDTHQIVPGYDVPVIDTTGAGDAFWGGFLCQLTKSTKPLEAIDPEDIALFARFANAVAAICIGRRGGIPAMPDLQTVTEFMRGVRE